MNKILCATDGTDVSRKAEIWAGRVAKKLGSRLVYVYISGVGPEDITSTVGDMVILDAVEARKHDVLKHCEMIIKEHGLDAQCMILNGHEIAPSIVAFAETEGFDHIVTGTKGHLRGISGLFLGSVATEVIQKAHCPVTVVR